MLTENKCLTSSKKVHRPEIWGGLECTINRVGDVFRDQLESSGHYHRENDIEEIAALGIRTIRYPILWEKHQLKEKGEPNWDWIEQQLEKLKQHHITPIAGLLHHGSGPAYTNLADPLFPEKFAAYAKLVATRFSWIEYYTPVNEPLTTARFSGLYGVWYPHETDAYSFNCMLLNEVKATVLAMQEIRKINPNAKLVQTEDITKVQSTSRLKYQAVFENDRRWLTYDLLFGRVNSKHPLWNYFITSGIKKEELVFFLENKCAPDIIGCNYYVTSERFLDHDSHLYPGRCAGSNGKHSYVDLESVRVQKMLGLKTLIKEVWKRYKTTIAITEVHLHCTREEQMRWLMEAWENCCELKREGIDLKALTVWAMLGSFDWNSLLTVQNNVYESGVFDIRDNQVRKTALAKIISSLNTHGSFDHPVLEGKGWWHVDAPAFHDKRASGSPLLIIGKNGTLGKAFEKICHIRSINTVMLSRNEMNICDKSSIAAAIDRLKPWAIINTAGFVKVDEAENCADECRQINAYGAGLLANQCNKLGIRYMTFSSDMVFDGNKRTPYLETDSVNPVNVYGQSKAEGEALVMDSCPSSLIVRSSSFFGPWDTYNFAYHVLHQLRKDQSCAALNDVYISPTYVPDLVNASLDIFIDEATGIWHVTNDGTLTWADFARAIAGRAGISGSKIKNIQTGDASFIAPRPLYSVLGSQNGIHLPALDDAIERYFMEKAV